jgi:hypothetical protein
MKKKIVFFDIDGTMIDIPAGMLEPLPSTIKAIEQLRLKGHYSVIATARASMPEAFSNLNFDGFIFCNGNYIEFQNNLIYDNFFSEKHIKFLVDLFKQKEGQYIFNGHFGKWTSLLTHPLILRQVELFGGSTSEQVNWKMEDVHANMVTALFETEKQLFDCKANIPSGWVVDAYTTGNIRMDIHLPGYTKGTAVGYLYEKLGVSFYDTFAFGDSCNDIEMLKTVKRGIAMGNATDEIKAIAFDITDDVTNDGIYNELKKYNVI